ncbi:MULTISPECIES: TetR/AcrR family transcriptional regulator [unclassified Variovorax]|uniref:TetR/AcrR family transcriptional regulator n=1 Tax=unclassified Variovorax TaxID=663243 RepID=UPI001BD3E467|nr:MULTISPECIES: TetR/AcrR family transcriptional regulator [unclassified Variovorax]
MPSPRPPPASRKASPPARPRPGRPRKQDAASGGNAALGRERILQAALDLIDRKGLPAFNIRQLAANLGVFPAAIYWHVPSRDALVSGAIALALAEVATGLPDGTWQVRLRAVLQGFREALRQHPHLAPAVASELSCNAAFDAPLLQHVVAALEDARFEGDALVDAFNVVIAAMCGFATLELSSAPADDTAAWEAACRAQIDAVDHARHPHLGRNLDALRNRAFLLRWSSGKTQPLASGFEAWVDVVLRGLESRSRALRAAERRG